MSEEQRGSAAQHIAIRLTILVAACYFTGAYVLAPVIWLAYSERHPALEHIPNVTYTSDGHPGDPLNVALVGSEVQLHKAMLAAGWYPADAITFRSSVRIAVDTVIRKPYDDAPVSGLRLFGRKQDFAFEKPDGKDPRKRHHVRFWKSARLDAVGRPIWIGAATHDDRVGLSYTTGEVTHHVDADVDRERDTLMADLTAAKALAQESYVDNFHKTKRGYNGGGDLWFTDGRLAYGVLK